MSGLRAHAVVRRGAFALDARLDVAPGEVVALLGPNGAGKTTLLRALAGLEPLAGGRLELAGTVLDDPARRVLVPPEARRVGVVFQDHRLFPHLDVLANCAFPLRVRGASRRAARAAAGAHLDRLGLRDLAARRPHQLSGGQAQRVALARALAAEPALLLLDEPFAALDAGARRAVRTGLRADLARFPGPVVVVTHDPVEALVLADRLVVLEGGRVVQDGPPAEVARRPATAYVAGLVGLALWPGRRDGGSLRLAGGAVLPAPARAPAGPVLVAAPPAALRLVAPGTGAWDGEVGVLEPYGSLVRVHVDGAPPALVDVPVAAVPGLGLVPGARVGVAVDVGGLEVWSAGAVPTT
ncbi:ABC transporter ATP-binding protein [Vallicoccus soli]|uniref:ABC transporter ATP-binding protein n=1 Tax=Vallicoccus soli TaxID=2339232 RepID=UPI001C49B465|nr:ABC transporter ATP-binding protein [Vallicoccus soli]